MADSNPTRARQRERFQANKRAFDDVFGDPFAHPEPIEGYYLQLKSRSSIAAMKNNFDEGKATRNPAAPNLIDFFCDAERIVSGVFQHNQHEIDKFTATYVTEDCTTLYTPQERADIEQAVGKLLIAYKISPVSRYFRTLRQVTRPAQPKG